MTDWAGAVEPMSIIITGAGGQVGRELIRQATLRDRNFQAFDREQLDITRRDGLADRLAAIGATAIINAAAYTAVDQAEQEPKTAHRINAEGAESLALASASLDIPILHISTDYVFDGTASAPYGEDDQVNPMGIYARSKEAGEQLIRNAHVKHLILRTAWVFGAHGVNFVKTMRRLAADGRRELRVVNDQYGGPTPARAIADAILDMIDQVRRTPETVPWGTYHFCGAPAVNWHQFATAVLTDQADMRIKAIPSSEYPLPAPRPTNSVLDCSRICDHFGIQQPDWRIYLDEILAELASDMEE